MEYKSCFILMPFSKTDSLNKDDLDYIYTHIIKKAITDFEIDGRKYFDLVERFEGKVGSIVAGIVKQLNSAELVIADLTGLNPNVMYELGVRHSLKRGTIIITQDINNLPSDLRDYLIVEYKYADKTLEQPKLYDQFKEVLYKAINELMNTNKFDSPVLSYLTQKQRFREEDEINKLKGNTIITDAIFTACEEIRDLISTVKSNKTSIDEELYYQLFNLKLNNLSTTLNELNISYHSSILYENLINAKSMLSEIMKSFNMNDYFNSFNLIDSEAIGFFGPRSLDDTISKKIVNLFLLTDENKLEFVTMESLFKKNGILEDELLDYLTEYIEKESKRLGVEESEINDMLIS